MVGGDCRCLPEQSRNTPSLAFGVGLFASSKIDLTTFTPRVQGTVVVRETWSSVFEREVDIIATAWLSRLSC